MKLKIKNQTARIGVVGLGYVGLPLAVEFGMKFKTLGFDINETRIQELKAGIDHTLECSPEKLAKSGMLNFSTDFRDLKACEIYIITVPTPIDKNKTPDLRPLISATTTVGKVLDPGNLVIYESTVYPGLTEEILVPIIQKNTKFKLNKDFFLGYSPERINPGDKKHTLKNTHKILAIKSKNLLVKKRTILIYKKITNKIVLTSNIKEAEMAKLVENVQRDINIAITNDIFLFSKKMGFDFKNIINLAATKWNFRKYNPGLVGGHCLPVDPYYLIDVAKRNSIKMRTVLSGRVTNNQIGKWAQKQIENKIRKNQNKRIYFLGITYKKNSSDTRNSMPLNIYKNLKKKYPNLYAVDQYCSMQDKRKFKVLDEIKTYSKNCYYIFLLNHRNNIEIFKKIKKNKLDFYDPFGYFQ